MIALENERKLVHSSRGCRWFSSFVDVMLAPVYVPRSDTLGTSIWIIVLAVIVATLLLGNAVWCCMFRGRGKRPETSSLPVSVRNPNADADAVRLQNAEAQIRRLQ